MTQTHADMPETNLDGDHHRSSIAAGSVVKVVHNAPVPALRQAGIYTCGYGCFSHPTVFENKPHRLWSLTICLSGAAEVMHRGSWQPFEAGTARLCPPGADMKATRCVPQQRWEVVWVRYLPDAQHITALFPSAEPVTRSADGSPLRRVIEELHSEHSTANDPLVIEHWIALVNLNVKRLLRGQSADPRLHKLWSHVRADLARHWVVDDLAAIIGTSAQHLRRLCAAHLGVSPMRQVNRLRVDHAAGLLAETDRPISQIAEQVGFHSPFSFSRAFTRQLGQSPSAYRNRFMPMHED